MIAMPEVSSDAGLKAAASRVVRQTSQYAAANVVLKASGFALAFLYLNPKYLSVEDFGYFGLLITGVQLGTYVVGLGLDQALVRFMSSRERPDTERLPFTVLVVTAGAVAVVAASILSIDGPIARVLLDDVRLANLIDLSILWLSAKVLGRIPLTLVRIKERPGLYLAAILAESVLLIAAAYLLVVTRDQGLLGLVRAHAFSAAGATLAMVGAMLVRVEWRFDHRAIGPLVRFGGPMILATGASWFLSAGDRYLLKWLAGAAAVGLYEWAYRLAGVVNLLLVQSFNLAFSVIGTKSLSADSNGGRLHRELLRHYVSVVGWAALAVAVLASQITALLPADPGYTLVGDVVAILMAGFVSSGVYVVILNAVFARSHSGRLAVITAVAASLNAVLNIALIPLIGIEGAAVATWISYLTLALMATRLARKVVDIRFPWIIYGGVLAVISGLYVMARAGAALPPLQRMTGTLLIIFAYPVVLHLVRLYPLTEWRIILAPVLLQIRQRGVRKRDR
jgi:O-antigen/teichoic acid export membrane protein